MVGEEGRDFKELAHVIVVDSNSKNLKGRAVW